MLLSDSITGNLFTIHEVHQIACGSRPHLRGVPYAGAADDSPLVADRIAAPEAGAGAAYTGEKEIVLPAESRS